MTDDETFTRLTVTAGHDWYNLSLLLESTRAELLDVDRQLSAERERYAALVAELAQHHANCAAELELREVAIEHNANEAKRWHSRFHCLARAARPVFEDWLLTYNVFVDAALTAEVAKMKRDANEMLTLLDATSE